MRLEVSISKSAYQMRPSWLALFRRDSRQWTEALLTVSPAIDQPVGGVSISALWPRRINRSGGRNRGADKHT
jgi:hypothetical protein